MTKGGGVNVTGERDVTDAQPERRSKSTSTPLRATTRPALPPSYWISSVASWDPCSPNSAGRPGHEHMQAGEPPSRWLTDTGTYCFSPRLTPETLRRGPAW